VSRVNSNCLQTLRSEIELKFHCDSRFPLKGKEITISVIVSRINEAGTERAAEVESPLVLNGRTAEIDVLMSGILVLIQFVSWSRDKKASGLKTAHVRAQGRGCRGASKSSWRFFNHSYQS
jgi:hypothetical protein